MPTPFSAGRKRNQKADHRKSQEYEEKDFCDLSRSSSDPAETENRRDDRDHEENNSRSKHGITLLLAEEAIDGPAASSQIILMLFNQLQLSLLLQRMQESGYILESESSCNDECRSYKIWIPGPDSLFLMPESSAASAVQRFLWNQAELHWNSNDGMIRWRWRYWSPWTVSLHSLICLLALPVLGTGADHLAFFVGANLIPAAFYFWDAWKLRGLVYEMVS